MRSRAVLALVAASALVAPTAARAKSYTLPRASYVLHVGADGTAHVRERITFAFSGAFTGAYRDIPLPPGARITGIGVTEGARAYRPGASTQLGGEGAPGTFGTTTVDGHVARIVWHYAARDEARTFTLRYELSRVLVAHDDVVDVHPQVWGDSWPVQLGHLDVAIVLPHAVPAAERRAFRVWGHPFGLHGGTALRADRAVATLDDVPAGTAADVRVLFPRDLLTSTAAARRKPGAALGRIVDAERRAFEDRPRTERLADHPVTVALFLLAFGLLPALALLGAFYLRYGRERPTGYDRRYEREPPDALAPALVRTLLTQSPRPGAREFVATLFDLMRRGLYTTSGASADSGSDVVLARSERPRTGLAPFEKTAAKIVDDVLRKGPQPLSAFGSHVKDSSLLGSEFLRFCEQVAAASDFFDVAGDRLRRVVRNALLAAGVVPFFIGFHHYGRPGHLTWVGAGACTWLVALALYAAPRSLFVRRTPEAQASAERWAAFRRYLRDFPRLDQAPAISLALWEQLLVYGIAFGLAREVLAGAQTHLTDGLVRQSILYGPALGGTGEGGTWSGALGGALAGAGVSAGGGGGFGGDGGGSFGGGGGGAW